MLNPASVLKKTEAGLVAIKERDRSLMPRARTLLIMMDGMKNAGQLAAMNVDTVQGMELLGQLIQSGFAVPLEGSSTQSSPLVAPPVAAVVAPTTQPTAPIAATASPSASAPRLARDLKTSIRAGTRFLENWLGPVSESFCLQLERCKTPSEFEAKVLEIKLLLASARSAKKAEDFSDTALGL